MKVHCSIVPWWPKTFLRNGSVNFLKYLLATYLQMCRCLINTGLSNLNKARIPTITAQNCYSLLSFTHGDNINHSLNKILSK